MSLPKNFLRGINPENIILESRRQSPQKGKQVSRNESLTTPQPVNEPKGSPSIYSHHVASFGTPYGMPSTSFAPYETPLPPSHFKLPAFVPSTPYQRQNTMDSNITLLIQNQLSTAFNDFSLANNANLQQQQQLHQQQMEQMQQQHQQQLEQQQ